MRRSGITRRSFAAALAAGAGLRAADGEWLDLFNGRSLDGWRPSESQSSWKAAEGCLVADGPRSHLFYNGPLHGASFRNFELEVEALARPLCNSGVYFHTAWQETGFPEKGFEVQIANTATGDGTYRERKRTGSLYGLRNVYKQFVGDDDWFTLRVAVRGKSVQVHLNGMLVVAYVEPTPPVIPEGGEKQRFLDRGTFALQCHNPGSVARFRRVRVRPLPDGTPTPGSAPVVDDVFRQIIDTGRHNIPMVDYHVHLMPGMTLESTLAKSRADGLMYGIACNAGVGNPVRDDAALRRFFETVNGQPAFAAMQAEGREWVTMFSRSAVALFDYVFTDSMTWTDNRGRRMRLWIPSEIGAIADPQEFMETLVDRAVGIFEKEPVDIYVNPTYLPDSLAPAYASLWTEERMRKVADAAARNHVAIELNDHYKLPSPAFIRMAKAAGCKFAFGTNNTTARDLGRSEYGLQMVRECRLEWQDFFVPGAWWPKAIERKGDALRA